MPATTDKKRILKRVLCAVLMAVMLFSSVMTVFAWYDFTQSRTNDFRGTVAKTTVTLHKHEKTPEGNIIPRPVKNAAFLLFKQAHDGTWVQINGIFIADASGKISVPKLNSGTYKFVEQEPLVYGYAFDKDSSGNEIREYPFIVTPDDAEGLAIVAVEAYNRRLQSGLVITKTVEIMDGLELAEETLAEIANQEFEFTVTFSDGGTYEYQKYGSGNDPVGDRTPLQSGEKLHLKHGEKAVFDRLPVGIYYEVYETKNPDYILTSKNNTGSVTLNEIKMAGFTNTYGKPGPKKILITVEKIVLGEVPESEKNREFGFRVKVNDGEAAYFTLKAGEKKAFELNSGDTYSVTEEDLFGRGYIQTSSLYGTGTACAPDITVTFTNTYIGELWIDIDGEKTWDLGGSPIPLPSSVTVQLLANGNVVQTATVKPNSDGKWVYSFTAPKHDKDGEPITYTVREVLVPGFISVVTGNNIKNTRRGGGRANDMLLVEKAITGRRPAAADIFTFKLEGLNGAPMPEGSSGNIKTTTVTGEGIANFGNIEYIEAGTYTYRVSEVKGSAGCVYDETVYAVTVVVEERANGSLLVNPPEFTKLNDSGKYSKAAFINHYPSPEDTSVTVRKVWDGDENPAQPVTVSVQLYKNGVAHGSPVTLNAANGWKHTWTGLDKSSAWTVDETTVPAGYAKKITGSADTEFVITNTFTKPNESVPLIGLDTIIIEGRKTWNHGNAPENERPARITVYIKNGSKIVKEITVTAADNWQYSVKLLKYDDKGNPINYTVEEANVPRYTHTVDGHNITNTYKGPDYPGDVPKTGDTTNLELWITLIVTSFLALILVMVIGRRRGGKRRNPKCAARATARR